MKRFLSLFLAVLMLSSAAGCTKEEKGEMSSPPSEYLIAQAEYPETIPYPDEKASNFSDAYGIWKDGQQSRWSEYKNIDTIPLAGFFESSIPQFLLENDSANPAYSPLNVYMALGMLAELTDGNSRQQILDLLGSDDIKTLRTQASAIWKANYNDDGATAAILGSSLWLNEDIPFNQPVMDILADYYYASSYRGEMGSAGFDEELQNWLNDQTGSFLEEQASQIKMEPDTVMTLASTVYFSAKWRHKFKEENTEKMTFHAPDGDILCDFMNKKKASGTYYWGDRFTAVYLPFDSRTSETMWFILPDEDTTPEDLLTDPQVMDLLFDNSGWKNYKPLLINMAIPKFDVTSQTDLCDGLKALGITDVFDSTASDFSPMTSMEEIILSKAQHDVRVVIDEEGCTAAAYTVMVAAGGAMPPTEEVDFIADRPFLFAITSYDFLPLFVGIVNQPEE